MIKLPIVSVVVPVYNAEKYIVEALGSVASQTYTNFEVIVVNDCSSDNSRSLIEDFCLRDTRFKLLDLQLKCGGAAAVRNRGVQCSVGDWVAFLDADDVWHPNKLKRQMQLVLSKGALFCSTGMKNFHNSEFLFLSDFSLNDYEWISFVKQLIKFRTPTSSVLLHRSLIEKHRFNENEMYKVREDLDCWLHCHEEIGRSIKIKSPMVGYRINPGQVSGNKFKMVLPHYRVLSNYQFSSGRKLGRVLAIFFTFTHLFLGLYNRTFKNGM